MEVPKNPPPAKKNGKKEWTPTDTQIALNGLFHRRKTTKWSAKETKSYKAIDFTPEDLEAVTAYYAAPSSAFETDWRRRDLQTLLNNWTGEVDRAGQFSRGDYNKPKKSAAVARVVDTTPKKRRNWDDPSIQAKTT